MPTPLNIKDAEAYRLAALISKRTGKSLTRVVIDALKAEAERLEPRRNNSVEVKAALAELHRIPIIDDRDWEKELYDEKGLPA